MEQGSVTITRERRCDKCEYYEATREYYGKCRLHAPVPYCRRESAYWHAYWPEVYGDDWCGATTGYAFDREDAREHWEHGDVATFPDWMKKMASE